MGMVWCKKTNNKNFKENESDNSLIHDSQVVKILNRPKMLIQTR